MSSKGDLRAAIPFVVPRYIDQHTKLQKRPFNRFGRALLIGLFPILFIFGFIVGPGWLAARALAWPMPIAREIGWVAGTIVAVAGLSLYLWTIALFARSWGTQVPVAPTNELVTSGPYAVTRNPMVTSGAIMAIGCALVAGSWSFALPGLIESTLYLIYIRLVEERELAARFGEDYDAYRARTPFVVPRLIRRERAR